LKPEKESAFPSRICLWPLALLGILSVSALFASKGNQFKKSQPPHDKPNPPHNPAPRQSLVVPEIPPTPTNSNNSNGGKESTPPWKKRAEISIAIATLGLLVVNIGLMCANKKSADTAARQVADYESKESAQLIAKDVHLNTIEEVGGETFTIELVYSLKNIGATSAEHIASVATPGTTPEICDLLPRYIPIPGNPKSPWSIPAGAEEEQRITLTNGWPKEPKDRWFMPSPNSKRQGLRACFFIQLSYYGVFPQTEAKHLAFCGNYTSDLSPHRCYPQPK
jgi:hypothetical protein